MMKKSNPNRRGKRARRQDDQRSFDNSATRDRNGVTAILLIGIWHRVWSTL